MKRLLTYVVLFFFTIVPAAGCSGKKAASDDPWAGKELKQAKLTFYFPYAQNSQLPVVLKEVEKRAGEKLNISLDFKCIPGNMEAKVRELIEAGQPCDAFLLNSNNIKPFLDLGLLKDITKLFPRYAPRYYSSFEKEHLTPLYNDGKLIGVPPNSVPNFSKYVAYVRDDVLSKYGEDKIDGLDDYGKFLEWIKKNDPTKTPLYLRSFWTTPYINAFGYSVVSDTYGVVYRQGDKDLRLLAWEQTPEFKTLYGTFMNWFKNGYLTFTSNQGGNDESELIASKNASFIDYYSFGRDEYFNNLVVQNGDSWKYRMVELFPKAKYDRRYNTGEFITFNYKSPNVERALMFIDWLQSDIENYKLLTLGIKGEHYILDDKKGPTPPKDTEYLMSYMSWAGLRVFHNYNLDAKLSKDSDVFYKSYIKTIEDNTTIPLHSGFTFDQVEMSDFINQLDSDRYRSLEYRIISGRLTMDEVERYIQNRKQVTDKIVDRFQQLVNAWSSEKK